jgi:hypothetical protein
MTSLHERLCTWVQVKHLYQPTRNGLLDVYLQHHVAHCANCKHEIEAIQFLGTAVAELDFSVPSSPDDASWARLSASLPPREFHPAADDIAVTSIRRPVHLRKIAYGAIACAFAGVAFGAVYFKTSRGEAPVGTPQVAVNASANVNVKSPAMKEDTALAFTREQAQQVATVDNTTSDPFAKSVPESDAPAALPPSVVNKPVSDKRTGGLKPLIVASAPPQASQLDVHHSETSLEMAPQIAADQLPAAPRMAMRSSAAPLQSVTPMDASQQGTTQASYMPSPAMELTETQNRLRSLLQ